MTEFNRLDILKRNCRLKSRLARCLLCEFIATTFLMWVGLSIDSQMLLSRHQLNSHLAHSLGWGLALVLAVQIAFNISGSHLNPAVSFFFYSFGKLSSTHFLYYSLAQFLGAFLGAALTFTLYYEKIAEFDGGIRFVSGPNATAAIFSTYPGVHLGLMGAIIDQLSCTFILCFSIGVITDERNKIPKSAQPPLMGVMLAMICMGFGMNAGNGMNPARDFGPRVFSWMAGYGWEVFSFNNYTWFWVPLFCPFGGALLGAWTYELTISAQIAENEEGVEEERGEYCEKGMIGIGMNNQRGKSSDSYISSTTDSSPKLRIPTTMID